MANFQDILNQPWDEIEAPVPLPVGTYLCIVEGVPEVTQRGKNQNTAVIFNLKFMQPQADVDQHALINALKGKTLPDRSIKYTMWVTDDAKWRLKQFLKDHLEVEATNFTQALALSQGKQVYATIGHRPSEDGMQIYMDVKSTAKV